MKKTYIKPEIIVVSLKVRDNVMINGSAGGDQILGDGGEGGTSDLTPPEPGGDIYTDAREVIRSRGAWEEW